MSAAGLTLRELMWMADGKRRDAWKHTSALLAMHYNRTLAKGQPLPPSAFVCDQGKQIVARPGVCDATLQAGLRCRGLDQNNRR